jgi:type III secretory pathway component EscV
MMTDEVKNQDEEEVVVEERTKEQIADNLYDNTDKKDEVADESKEVEDKEDQEKSTEKEEEVAEDAESKEQEEKVEKEPVELELTLSKDSLLEDSDLTDHLEYAKEKELSQEVAQELLEQKEAAVLLDRERQSEVLRIESDEWAKEIMTDKRLGGAKFEESQKIARKPLDDSRFVNPEDREQLDSFLKKTNLADHPIFFRLLHGVGEAMSDGEFVKGAEPIKRKLSTEEKFYGEQAVK